METNRTTAFSGDLLSSPTVQCSYLQPAVCERDSCPGHLIIALAALLQAPAPAPAGNRTRQLSAVLVFAFFVRFTL